MSAKCPICRAPMDKAYRPFCSKRCADVDLGRWLKGVYVVPGVGGEADGAKSEHAAAQEKDDRAGD